MSRVLAQIKCKELKPIVRLAIDQGWQVSITGGNHLVFRSPAGASVYTAGTPSKARGRYLLNVRADLRRAGLDV
jgi:predicted RNA binding protein YcfA (HicA-like mRNA interferase family)